MWITPTATTIKTRISGPEFDTLRSAARSAGQQPDALVSACISTVVTRIRGAVGAKNKLGEEGTIPDELEGALGALWVHQFITRLPGQTKLLDAARTAAYEDAIDQLKDVARGLFAIVPPETAAPDTQQAGGPGIAQATPTTSSMGSLSGSGLL